MYLITGLVFVRKNSLGDKWVFVVEKHINWRLVKISILFIYASCDVFSLLSWAKF